MCLPDECFRKKWRNREFFRAEIAALAVVVMMVDDTCNGTIAKRPQTQVEIYCSFIAFKQLQVQAAIV